MGTVERKVRERERRRAEILQAARALFLSKGYEATTMPAIAQAAELAPGTLYLYFRSKASLYLELLDEGYAMLLSMLDDALRPASPAREQAAAFIDTFFRFARGNPSYFDIIFFVVQREGRTVSELLADEGVSSRLERRQQECKRRALGILKLHGGWVPEGDAELVVDAVWAMLAGVVRYFIKDSEVEYAAVCAKARQLILDGLFPPVGRTAGKGGAGS